ncbi:MAG: aminotransferase class I/II-fold pyridoxal phosphate-dependent enzyme [Puniceicoccales bacterium]|jgi:LL-diaminopimelate aminotransferase|nr:aminotransferase class I/II-fold pyridoxal phosphate-dependent enzyme [Puniceicoccales bacterium]
MDVSDQFAKKFFSTRIGGENFGDGKQMYKFEKIKRARVEATKKFPSRILIDMGVGEPDSMAADFVVETLSNEAGKYENRGYADNGCQEFKEAVARYMVAQFSVPMETSEIMHSIGTKAALSLLPYCFVNPGDIVLMTAPGYPVFGTHAKYLMADVISLPLYAKNDYLPDFEDIPDKILKKTKVVVVNYPNNPTGACATEEFFRKLVNLAHSHEFLVINDAAYSALAFDGGDKLSIFNIPGAKDVALELHSMSKGFNMTGWRLGWVCGNERLIGAYANVKNQSDSGQFLAIQKAAVQALENSFIPTNNARKYRTRMEKIIPILRNCGFDVIFPKAGFFLYAHIPSSVECNGEIESFLLAEKFTEWMICNLGIVTVPWDDAEPSVRFSMTFGCRDMEDDEIVDLFRDRMACCRFNFGKSG